MQIKAVLCVADIYLLHYGYVVSLTCVMVGVIVGDVGVE